ncbi:hypothetical protein [Corynebacterium glucuronolyticum]|uniref:hypothetical protein n=1 Tax=Corynebacterium glucuronolyticum TaxID=39791 RepID=UPI001E3BFEA6|nr:hypothetical protein [Corynebacterium glucuronolyticum]
MTRSSFYACACSVLVGLAVYSTALRITLLTSVAAILLCALAIFEYRHATARRPINRTMSLSILVAIIPLVVAYLGTFSNVTALILGLVASALAWFVIRLNTTEDKAGTTADSE